MTPDPSSSPTRLMIPSPGPTTWDVIAQWVAMGLLTAGVFTFIVFAIDNLFSSEKKREIKPFYLWIATIAFFGGLLSFFLPIAINSGFGKDDDGPVLRQLILYTTGGVLGVITLGETHRKNNQEKEKNENDHTRQVHAERRSRYTKAVEQLADEKATIRIGGIYTLVKLADEWLEDRATLSHENDRISEAQAIVDTLCSYIRTPFPLASKREILELEEPHPEYNGDFFNDRKLLLEEQWVRRTVFNKIYHNAINSHGRKKEWDKLSFNFTESTIFYPLNNITFKNPIFKRAIFYGEANFRNSKFLEGVDFDSAIFYGTAQFQSTYFTGYANFSPATFHKNVAFTPSIFEGYADFTKTRFIENSYFDKARFKGPASFSETYFEGPVDFKESRFENTAEFRTATFFNEATFTNAFFSSSPVFSIQEGDSKYNAKFSYLINPENYKFNVSRNSRYKIETERIKSPTGTLFDIPKGCNFAVEIKIKNFQSFTHVNHSKECTKKLSSICKRIFTRIKKKDS
ncbi:pentapeptide repeat-containing protein [uncultured Rothia sp.]|uniref:pentapeptide repeat-containing protein n=1 Tax=uncultured Rothia sp. TaxID=316088 RepID=UPI00261288BC|nr:pentapeptide repeat-containing protein [uncultured Rothia sp.]